MTPTPRKPASRKAAALPAPKITITSARRVAFEILTLVGERKGHSDELLHSTRTENLSPEDRNLATALVMGVLRWEIALDARIRTLLQRPEQRLAAPVALALRMGAFQLLHMDRIPAHAALSESVELCKVANQPHAAGMVNAILRKLAAAQRPGTRVYESVPAFAERLGHPLWLVERWVTQYGRVAALAICEAGQQEPTETPMFTETGGDLPQMDNGSRLVAEIVAAALPQREDGTPLRIWDCCAAPGGKTLMLARRLPAAQIVATDVSATRLAHMEARLRRYTYAESVQCSVANATVSQPEDLFDLILCDVPCSGTGTLARNPEIRHNFQAEELIRQAQRQRTILQAAIKRLAPGGRLVYSTCSLEPEENEQVVGTLAGVRTVSVEHFLERLTATGITQAEAGAGLLASAVRGGALRTLPGVHGCDGFFAVVLERE